MRKVRKETPNMWIVLPVVIALALAGIPGQACPVSVSVSPDDHVAYAILGVPKETVLTETMRIVPRASKNETVVIPARYQAPPAVTGALGKGLRPQEVFGIRTRSEMVLGSLLAIDGKK